METKFNVDARELHSELRVDTRFSDWIQRRIAKYKYRYGIDYIKYRCPAESTRGGRNKVEYSVSDKMANDLRSIDKFRIIK
jgi:phage anti-repressor protein